MAKKSKPSNKKPDPDPDHPSGKKIPPSKDVRDHEKRKRGNVSEEVYRHAERERLRKRLREPIPDPRTIIHWYPPYGFDPERDVKQPGPDEKNDARRFPRDKGLGGMLFVWGM
jgi:hypothetical protein